MLTFQKVDKEEDLKQVYRLRYQIYCLEKGYESKEKYPDATEMDEYDVYSIHFVAKVHDEAVGTVRLILNNPLGFPAEKYCKTDITAFRIKKEQTVEISRFAVSNSLATILQFDRTLVLFGLFREMYYETKRLGIENFCAAMGKGLQRLLGKYGIIFFAVGPTVDYHGPRSLHVAAVNNIEQSVIHNNQDLSDFVCLPHYAVPPTVTLQLRNNF